MLFLRSGTLSSYEYKVHWINILSKRGVLTTSKYLSKTSNLQNITKHQMRWKCGLGKCFFPQKKKKRPLIRKGYQYLRKTGLKFTVTYRERSENKPKKKKLIKFKNSFIKLWLKYEISLWTLKDQYESWEGCMSRWVYPHWNL